MKRYIILSLTIALFLICLVYEKIQSIRWGYKINALNKEFEYLEQENKRLRFKLMNLTSMENLDNIAKAKKLITPDQNKIIYIEK